MLNERLVTKYPQTAAPTESVMQKLITKFRETDSVANAKRNRVRTFCTLDNIERVQETW